MSPRPSRASTWPRTSRSRCSGKQHNRNVEIVVYPGATHGFFADYRPSFNATAAADAWKRCTDWFAKSLKA
ncbi:MAG: hypothetical protein DME10_21160 [Candidatus Rokuibacteriota bacterium]|nr:MAG: hypothetical protein DME10_21160 [Candidatus Rokubacteria bacterium]